MLLSFFLNIINRAVIKDYCHYCSQVLLWTENIMNYQNKTYWFICSSHSHRIIPFEVTYSPLNVELPWFLLAWCFTLLQISCLWNLWLTVTCTFVFLSIIQISFLCLMVLFRYQNWWWRLWDVLAIKFAWAKGDLEEGCASLSKCKKRKLRKWQDPVIRHEWAFLCCIGGQSEHNRGNNILGSTCGPTVLPGC